MTSVDSTFSSSELWAGKTDGSIRTAPAVFSYPRSVTIINESVQRDLFEIVYEDADLLVINKPASLVCHPTKGDLFSSLISRVRLYLNVQSDGQSECHLINRLDRETSGLILVAKNLPVARDLRSLWEIRQVKKEYVAIVNGKPALDEFTIDMPLGKDERSPVAIKDWVRPDGRPAQTEFRRETTFVRPEGIFSVLRVRPLTGRKHQIRIHAAFAGHPIVGDKLYGPDENHYLTFVKNGFTAELAKALFLPNHALHAAQLDFSLAGRDFSFRANPPMEFWNFVYPQNGGTGYGTDA